MPVVVHTIFVMYSMCRSIQTIIIKTINMSYIVIVLLHNRG